MGSGSAGIGGITVETHNHIDPERTYPDDDHLYVAQVWTSAIDGVELSSTGLDEHIFLTDADTARLVALLCVAGEINPAGETVRQHVRAIMADLGWPEETDEERVATGGRALL